MSHMPEIKAKDLETMLLRLGWQRVTDHGGSHAHFAHNKVGHKITFAAHNTNHTFGQDNIKEIFALAGLPRLYGQLRGGKLKQSFSKFVKRLKPNMAEFRPIEAHAA